MMKLLLIAAVLCLALAKESSYEKEPALTYDEWKEVQELLKEKEGKSSSSSSSQEEQEECPGPFTWNLRAKRCQRLIESGNTQFIKTKCCALLVKKEEAELKAEGYETPDTETKKEILKEVEKEIDAEEIRSEAAYEEENGVASVENAYEAKEEEEDDKAAGGCMKRCYYRKYEGAPQRPIPCERLKDYRGRRTCFKGGKEVPCRKLRCQLVHEVKVEKEDVKCRRVCYYRPYAGSRIKRRIKCSEVDTKYVGDKKCAINGKPVRCSKLRCNV